MTVWYMNPIFHAVVLAVLGAVITTLTPYAAANIYVAFVVAVVTLILGHINATPSASQIVESPSAPKAPSAPKPDDPTYTVGGVTVNADVFAPLGQVDTIGAANYTVGLPIANAITISGAFGNTTVPAGSVYVGKRVFFNSALKQYFDT